MSTMTRPNGLLKTTGYLRKDQYLRLHAESLQEAVDRGGGRPDVARKIRDIIDVYFEAQDAAAAASIQPQGKSRGRQSTVRRSARRSVRS